MYNQFIFGRPPVTAILAGVLCGTLSFGAFAHGEASVTSGQHSSAGAAVQATYDPVSRFLYVPAVSIDGQLFEASLTISQVNPIVWRISELNPLNASPDNEASIASFDVANGAVRLRNVKIAGRGFFDFNLSLQPGTPFLSQDSVAADDLIQSSCMVWTADRLFDGMDLYENKAILIESDTVSQVGTAEELHGLCDQMVNLGDATIMPGFIESHSHLAFQNVDSETVLKHGITTARETGGPLSAPQGGSGTLRIVGSGPIIQATDGYPMNIFGGTSGYDSIGIIADTAEQGREIVRNLVSGGANVIKVALEPGGESGAPWSYDHGHGAPPATPWPMPPLETVQAIVEEAHSLGKKVTAHIGETEGATIALAAGVDEWAHIPCAALDDTLLQQAVDQGVKFVTTVDTLSSCAGIYANTVKLGTMIQNAVSGAELIYGSEIGHDNVPWGINAQELHLMLHAAGMAPQAIFQAATAKAGINIGLAPLGTLIAGAPADMIAVRGNPFTRFKPLEYPDLVISGGRIIVNQFATSQ